MYDIYKLNEKSLVELKEIALKLGIENINVPKEELVYSIIDQQATHPDTIKEINNENRTVVKNTTDKPKRGRKVATSRPDKKENAEIIAESNRENAKTENKNEVIDSQDGTTASETKPKREKRPRIGKRTDVVKTTINNNDEQNKVQHVSYGKPDNAETKESNNNITNETITNEESVSVVEEKTEVYETKRNKTGRGNKKKDSNKTKESTNVEVTETEETNVVTETTENDEVVDVIIKNEIVETEKINHQKREEIISEFDAVVNAEGVKSQKVVIY